MPVAPVVTSITFDKASYNKGDTITATVSYQPGSSDQTQTFTGSAIDQVTGLAGQLTVTFAVAGGASNPTTVSASDSGSRGWTPKSNVGGVAVFTAVA
jgi:hypothetical protein